jgi:hypothetical protein
VRTERRLGGPSPEGIRDALLIARAELLAVRHGLVQDDADPEPDDAGIMQPIAERERVLTAMIDRQLKEIEAALHRLDRGRYGRAHMTAETHAAPR